MYGYQGPRTTDGTKALLIFVGLLLIGAVIAGLFLGDAEFLSPSLNKAKVEKLQAETDMLRNQTAYQQRQYEIELRSAEEQAKVELQALQNRRAKELELLELSTIIGLIIVSVAIFLIAASVSYYIFAKVKVYPTKQASQKALFSQSQISASTSARKQQDSLRHSHSSPLIQKSEIDSAYIGYDTFLAFCFDFVLSADGSEFPLDYTRPDCHEKHHPEKIAREVAQTCLLILSDARIVIPSANGHCQWRLHPRINNINDIVSRIPLEAFYQKLTTISQNKTVHFPQLLTFPVSHQRKEPRSAA